MPTELLGIAALQATAGRFEHADGEVRFRPRFPLVPGTSYTLLLDGLDVASTTMAQRVDSPRTRVTAIYPTAHEVPLNLLKIYIQFSAPMAEDQAPDAVRVRRADNGRMLEGVFLPMQPELWDAQRTRLTLLLDPGRIKRGLAPHLEMGYPLEEGVPVVVRVDGRLDDASGVDLVSGMERRYNVVPAVRRHVSPAAWHLRTPRANSIDPLCVEFDRPLDYALLEHSLAVLDARGRRIDGRATISDGELSWSFTPYQMWRSEGYAVRVDPRLEDLAGNSVRRVFDRDLTCPEDAPLRPECAAVQFEPRRIG